MQRFPVWESGRSGRSPLALHLGRSHHPALGVIKTHPPLLTLPPPGGVL
ncbi:hypothetical protein [Nodosilinea nodulosa]|nr:hypothetical protein [Nodosilinea nodulosa]